MTFCEERGDVGRELEEHGSTGLTLMGERGGGACGVEEVGRVLRLSLSRNWMT
jgi:hypothetical protein